MPSYRHRVVITRTSPTNSDTSRIRAGFEIRRDPASRLSAEVGPGVLLMHGQPGSSLVWARLEPLLHSCGLDAMTVDRPGSKGRRPWTVEAVEQVDEAAALAGLLAERRRTPTVVVAHGHGAGVAVALAAAAPGRVRGIVLVAPVFGTEAIPVCDRLIATPVLGPALSWLGFRLAGLALHQPRLRRHFLLERAGLTRRQADQVVRAFTRGRTWRRFAIERRQVRADAQQLTRRLAQIRCPAFVIAGRSDHLVSMPAASDLAARIPHAQFTRTDTGHLIPIDDPYAVLDAVLRAHDLPPWPLVEPMAQQWK